MAVSARSIAGRVPGAQIALVRFAVGILAVAGARALGHADLRPRRWGWLVARGLFGGLAVVSYFGCIQHVGVGVATLLNYTAPVWSLLFSWALLGERPRRNAVAALVLTLAGVVLVAGRSGSLAAGFWQGAGGSRPSARASRSPPSGRSAVRAWAACPARARGPCSPPSPRWASWPRCRSWWGAGWRPRRRSGWSSSRWGPSASGGSS